MLFQNESDILDLIRVDEWRMDVLRAVRVLDLPDWWIGAGFVRAAVWDALYEKSPKTFLPDVDVLYFNPVDCSKDAEKLLEAELVGVMPDVPWSVKNQARMHLRNGDPPYASCSEALMNWVETATAIAVRLEDDGSLRLLAPLGIADLLAGIIRPTPRFKHRLDLFWTRQTQKKWREIWPELRYEDGGSR